MNCFYFINFIYFIFVRKLNLAIILFLKLAVLFRFWTPRDYGIESLIHVVLKLYHTLNLFRWVDSWVSGGSLIEGPEIIKHGGEYYLFFASGKYCQDTYMEGVARSKNIWGPYTKLEVPILSTGIVGTANGIKLIGPGHASIVENYLSSDDWTILYHASIGNNCQRYVFINSLKFGSDGWPFVNF